MDGEAYFSLDERRAGSRVTLRLDGELDMNSATELLRCISELSLEGVTEVVIDLQTLEFCDSAGVQALSILLERANDVDAVVRVTGVHGAVRRLFELTRFDQLVAIDG